VRKVIREPLVHFLLIGAGLFVLFGWRGNPALVPGGQSGPQSSKIIVTQGAVDQLVAMFTKTWQRPPSQEEVEGLVKDFVREEIYYREALAIGLDREDTVVRRRMRQKMEFIFEDISAQSEPTDEDLLAHLKKHPDLYSLDPRVSFLHVYVNEDRRGRNSEADARQILARLRQGVDPATAGDPFLMEQDDRLCYLWEIRKQFGEAFTKSLIELKPGKWEGPVRSGFGLHLVFVNECVEGRLPELNEVRELVKRDWEAEQRKILKEAAYTKLRERYTVEFEKPKANTASAVAEAGTRTEPR
jgi:hypothetical protein